VYIDLHFSRGSKRLRKRRVAFLVRAGHTYVFKDAESVDVGSLGEENAFEMVIFVLNDACGVV